MRYDPNPPYAILSTRDISFEDIQRINRFARFWDLVGNSGRFSESLPLILADQPFARFLQFSDGLYAITGSTWQISLKRLFELTYTLMTSTLSIPADSAKEALAADFDRSGEKGQPDFLQGRQEKAAKQTVANKRQKQSLLQASNSDYSNTSSPVGSK